MSALRTKVVLMICLGVAAAAVVFAFPRFAQDPRYHEFADQRRIAGVPNLLNVVSNAMFAVAGILGLRLAWKHARGPAAVAFFLSAVLVAAGSAYYHVRPTNQTLVWDRLPMTVAFMSLLALVIGDRIDVRAGRLLLGPLIAVGMGSVIYWRLTEAVGRGDLRPVLPHAGNRPDAVPVQRALHRDRGVSRRAGLVRRREGM
jgi:hypothetical protein